MTRNFSRSWLDRDSWTFYPRLWLSLGPVNQEAVLDKFEQLVVRIECGQEAGGFAAAVLDRMYQAYARLRTTILDTPLDEADFWHAQRDRQDPLWQAGDPREGMPR